MSTYKPQFRAVKFVSRKYMEDFFLNYTQKCTKSLIYTEDHLKVNIKVIVLVLGQENMQFSRLEMAHIQFIESHKTKLFLLHSYLWSDA